MKAEVEYCRVRAHDSSDAPFPVEPDGAAGFPTDTKTEYAARDPAVMLAGEAKILATWLTDAALPLWHSVGYDPARRAFCEFLGLDGRAIGTPGRVKIQACQIFVFAEAGRAGWNGPWRRTVRYGLRTLFRDYRRPDGGFRSRFADDAESVEDQAFVLIALAAVARFRPGGGRVDVAKGLLLVALQRMRHVGGGFHDADAGAPIRSRAHMRLLEAALAWERVNGDAVWRRLADEIVDLALLRFIDPQTGTMADRFDRSWGAAQSPDGRRDSPGLQFAAAAQLETWGRRRGDESARRAASRLYEAGCLGMGGYSGGAADEPDGKFGRLGVSLCTQAERLRAAAAFARGSGAPRGHYQTEAIEACRALRRYLDTPVRGSWRDTLGNDGRFSFGPTSSENLFHIVAAAGQLGLAARETDAAAAPVAGGAAYRRSVRFAAFGRAPYGLADREAR